MYYLITYDLQDKGDRDYTPITRVIQSFGTWWHYLKSTWIIYSTEQNITVDMITERLIEVMNREDRLFVVKLEKIECQGWLPKKAWEWIKNNGRNPNP